MTNQVDERTAERGSEDGAGVRSLVAGGVLSRRDLLQLFAAGPLLTTARSLARGRLPREQLLLYHDTAGRVRRVTTIAEWLQRRAEILRGFRSIAGGIPGKARRCPLAPVVEERVDCGEFVRQRLTYQAEPGARVPAYLLVPRTATPERRCPGVLCLHQTHPAGPNLVVGLGNSPDDEYGVELARRGFVCLATPYPLVADYRPDLARLGYVSGTMKAVWDNMRGLDLLDTLPFVKQGEYAAVGHSLGAHNAIFTATCDRRIRVVVSSCGFDSFLDYADGNMSGWAQQLYMPRLGRFQGRAAAIPFDFHELLGAIAPRPILVSAPLHDLNFKSASVDRVAAAASEVYRLYRADDGLTVRHPDCGHRFPPEIRAEAYDFIQAHLAAREPA